MASSPPAKTPSSPLTTFATSGFGGLLGWVFVHPFNTVAVRMNLANASGVAPQSFLKFSRGIVANEGFSTLYSGLSAGCMRQVFYTTSRLGFFEIFRDYASSVSGGEVTLTTRLVSATTAGALAALISCPCEVSLVRMSNDKALPPDQRRNYSSVFSAASRIAREEGVAAYWRGSAPFVTRAVVVGATQVATYDQFKDTFQAALGLPKGQLPNTFASAMSAGFVYSVLTMPFETAKNRMAFQKADAATGRLLYRTTVQTIRLVAEREGVMSLWNGFAPYYLRSGGHTVAMFVIMEQLRVLMNAARSG